MRKLIATALLLGAAAVAAQGSWLQAKAWLAQWLIADAWAEQLQAGAPSNRDDKSRKDGFQIFGAWDEVKSNCPPAAATAL